MKKKRLIIRADGNAKIGAGHLMRCLTIACELHDKDSILFVCADEFSAQTVMEYGFSSFVLHTDYRDMISEIPVWDKMAEQNMGGIGLTELSILVDSYYANAEYIAALKRYGKVFLLDDMADAPKAADGVINYNAFAKEELYHNWQGVNRFFLGSEYIPLRPQFVGKSYGIKEKITDVLITTGGGDKDNIAGKILKAIYQKGITYHVVVGKFNPNYDALCEYADGHEGVMLHHDVSDMASLMAKCQIAVTAGGTTVYELCSIGVPFVCFAYAENQEKLVEYIGEKSIAFSAGHYHRNQASTIDKIKQSVETLCCDMSVRMRCMVRERELVDGQGAKRLARVLEQ